MARRFSVVVPTYERPAALRACLAALTAQDYPRDDFEIVVVDDGSPTPLAADALPAMHGVACRLLRVANGGPGGARNVGAAAAEGRYLAFTDDDCRPAPGWLRELDAALARAPAAMVGGRTVNALDRNGWAATSQVIVAMAYEFYNADPARARFFAANNLALPADLFAAVGGFCAEGFRVASEDRELCDRWRHAGHRLAYAPEAVVAHAHELTLESFCRQHFRYGRGAMRYHRVRMQRHSGRLREDLPFHVQLPRLWRRATHAMTARERGDVAWRLLLWQLCNAAGYAYEHVRDRVE